MTREEAKKELWRYGNLETLSKEEANELLDKIYDDFEKELKLARKEKTCDGCLHKPKKDEDYRLECGECSRFYLDKYNLDWENEL